MYPDTPAYLKDVVRIAGALKKEQLLSFFSDADDAIKVEYYIRTLVKDRRFDYNEATDIIRWHDSVAASDADIKSRIRAFWVIVSFRSKAIREIQLLRYPNQFIFVTADGKIYDLTVCHVTGDAFMAMRTRKAWLFDGVEDECNHIAIVPNAEFGESLGAYGFDSYCIFDGNYNVRYGQWM